MIFWQALLQNPLPAAISQFLDPLFLWPMYCHFGRCRTQSGGGKMFWKTADAFWIIFPQALLQSTLPAAISWFLDPLFLWPMYCHFGRCRTQSGGGKTFWNTADVFWIIFQQAFISKTLVYVFCVAINQKMAQETCWKDKKYDYLATFGPFSETPLATEQQQSSNLWKHKKHD